jgi:hypothetical protein
MPFLIIALVFATICAFVAHSRGRSAGGWFCIGFFFGLFALIVLMVIPNLQEQEARERQLREQNRLLKEQVRINRMNADQHLGQHARRLAVHDRALGVDTSEPGQLTDGDPGDGSGAPPAAALPPPLPPPTPPETRDAVIAARWRYAFAQEARGPVSFASLKGLFHTGDVTAATLVWTEGMAEWRAVQQLPALLDSLNG